MIIPALIWALSATPSVPVTTFVLTVEANAWDVASQDVNGDSRTDVAVFACDEKSYPLVKFIAVFLADAQGGYKGAPDFTLPLPPTVSGAFFAEIDGAAPKELVTTDHTGATLHRFGGEGFVPFGESKFDSLLPSGSKEPQFLPAAAKDLDLDGIDEWIIPADLGYQVRSAAGLIAEVECDLHSEFQRLGGNGIEHRLPTVDTFTLPGESRLGIAFLSDTFADFAYGANWSEHSRYRIPVSIGDSWESGAVMKDIDGNGFPDLVITRTKGTIKIQVQTQIFLASAPFTYPNNPTMSFESSGSITAPFIEDVNGDGKQDLIFASIPFGVRTVVNFLVRNKVTVSAAVHLFKDGNYPEKANHKSSLTLDAPDGRELIAFTTGDFNGDGFIDLAVGSGEEQLNIHSGSKDEFISSKPSPSLKLPTFGVAKTHDLNANSSKDIIIYHLGGVHSKRVEVVVF